MFILFAGYVIVIDLMFGIVGFSIEACVCLFWALISFDFSILRAAIMSASNLHFSYPYPIPWLFPGSPLRTLSIVLSELLSGYNSDLKACMRFMYVFILSFVRRALENRSPKTQSLFLFTEASRTVPMQLAWARGLSTF